MESQDNLCLRGDCLFIPYQTWCTCRWQSHKYQRMKHPRQQGTLHSFPTWMFVSQHIGWPAKEVMINFIQHSIVCFVYVVTKYIFPKIIYSLGRLETTYTDVLQKRYLEKISNILSILFRFYWFRNQIRKRSFQPESTMRCRSDPETRLIGVFGYDDTTTDSFVKLR